MAGRKIDRDRLDLVEKLFLAGRSDRSISITVSKKFGVGARQVRNYIRIVRDRVAARFVRNPEAASARVESMLLETWKLCRNRVKVVTTGHGESREAEVVPEPDTKTMAVIAGRLGDLHGTFATRIEHTGTVGVTVQDAAASLAARIAERSRRDPDGGADEPSGDAGPSNPDQAK